jgi:hypothetical protein
MDLMCILPEPNHTRSYKISYVTAVIKFLGSAAYWKHHHLFRPRLRTRKGEGPNFIGLNKHAETKTTLTVIGPPKYLHVSKLKMAKTDPWTRVISMPIEVDRHRK